MHADPAVARFPEEIRHHQRRGDEDREGEAARGEHVPSPDREGGDEQDEQDHERVLRLQSHAYGDAERQPRAAAEGEPQRQPEDEHRGRLVERDRLKEAVRREQDGREGDQGCSQRLCPAAASELPGDERGEQDRRRTGEDREGAEADQRRAEQRTRRGREERRDRRELHVPALQMPPGDQVVELVALPAVAPREGEVETALQREHEEQRANRECRQSARLGDALVRPFRGNLCAHTIT